MLCMWGSWSTEGDGRQTKGKTAAVLGPKKTKLCSRGCVSLEGLSEEVAFE